MSDPKNIGPYIVLKCLGYGGFGRIYLCSLPAKPGQEFALKVSSDVELLKKEYKFLKLLNKTEGFAKVYGYGSLGESDYIVEAVLGRDLNYNYNDHPFSMECVCAIGLQALDRIETIHKNGILHRDIKPCQFLISKDQNSIHLIDFGMSCFYMKHNKHKEFKTRAKCKGSVSYASINTHLGFTQSRRDDLESFFYTILYLIRGSLP